MPHRSEVSRPHASFEARVRSDELMLALQALNTSASDPLAWTTIDRYVRRVLPRAEQDDARQEALLRICRSTSTLRAASAASAAAWVRVVCRSHAVDQFRAREGRGRAFVRSEPSIEIASPETPARELLVPILAAFERYMDDYLGATVPRASVRERRRVQGRATLRRLALEESLSEIADTLEPAVSLVVLTKWIERGRAVLIGTVEHLRARDPDAGDLFAPFAEIALDRRADAGRPRLRRRRYISSSSS